MRGFGDPLLPGACCPSNRTWRQWSACARDESGIALVLVLCFMLLTVAVGTSFILLAQSETYASMNYQQMTQARYAAEAGVHKAINYLLNGYTQPGAASDPMSAYNTAVWPVTYNNAAVVLSANPSVAANYPVAATKTAFNTAAQGTLAIGSTTVSYTATARLLSMRQVFSYGSTTAQVAQIWLITGDGTTGGTRPATVEVTATLEQQVVPFSAYGIFATASTCGALAFSGGVTTDSYDSTNFTLSGGHPVAQSYGGNVGTNGNLTESGGSVVNGSLSTPRTGVGNCKSGSVDALTQNGGATVTGGLIQLPQAVSYPTPATPSPMPPTGNVVVTKNTGCSGLSTLAGICSGSAGNLVVNAAGGSASGADFRFSGGATIHFAAGTYNLNSLSLSGGSTLVVDSGPVVFNIGGASSTNPVDFSGGSVSNATFVPSNFQIIYAGTNGVQISGGSATSLTVYAPNAQLSFSGGSGVWGSFVGKTVADTGGTAIHYDRHTPETFGVLSNQMLTSFSWKKY